jgi:deoxyribonuclease-4
MVRAVERAQAIGADALQVFVDNPTTWKRRSEPPPELPAFRARLADHRIGPVAVHASYLVNLAGPDDDLHERSVGLLASELAVAPDFGARFVNVHIGSHKGAGVSYGIGRLADGVARALAVGAEASPAPVLVLENAAGSGDGIGATIEELEAIFEAIAARGVEAQRVGLCLDTAHLWGAGHDIASAEGVDALVDKVAARIGLDRLAMIHLNDSRAARGSKLDRHQHLGAGAIGDGTGFRRLLTHPELAHVAYYLETPGMDEGYDAVNMERARRIAAGLPLEPLPPEAFSLRSAHARTPAA